LDATVGKNLIFEWQHWVNPCGYATKIIIAKISKINESLS